MKRFAAAFLLSALIAYGFVQYALKPAPARRYRFNASPDLAFAVGGLMPASEIKNSEDTMRQLYAAHCASPDRPMEVGPEELIDVVSWKRGTPVTVICPGSEVARRETLAGYIVQCEPERADLYVKLGRVQPDEMVGCLVVLGARDAVAADPGLEPPPAGFKAAFRLRNRTYVWTETQGAEGEGLLDNVVPLPEPLPQ